jgi:putative NADH-flavin reductase
MNIVIFGASGGTGQELVRQSLAAGHTVTAFVRNAASVQAQQGLTALAGDVYHADEVSAAILGKDAVLAALGARSLGKSDLLEVSTTNIVAGMKQNKVRRLIILGAAAASGDEALRYQPALMKLVIQATRSTILKWPMASQRAMHKIVMESGLDWTIVEPPMLQNGPRKGQYRNGGDALPRNGSKISRADVAAFMVEQLTNREWVGQTPHIAY